MNEYKGENKNILQVLSPLMVSQTDGVFCSSLDGWEYELAYVATTFTSILPKEVFN